MLEVTDTLERDEFEASDEYDTFTDEGLRAQIQHDETNIDRETARHAVVMGDTVLIVEAE